MSERYVVTGTRGGTFDIWRRCGDKMCGVFHGPIASTNDSFDAERIARALNMVDDSDAQLLSKEATP